MNRRKFCIELGIGALASTGYFRSPAMADSHEPAAAELELLDRDLKPSVKSVATTNEERLDNISKLSDAITRSILEVARDNYRGSDALNNSVRKLHTQINALYLEFPDNQLKPIKPDGKLETVAFPLVELSSFMTQGGGIFAENFPQEDQTAIDGLKQALSAAIEKDNPGAYNNFEDDHSANKEAIKRRADADELRKSQGASPAARPCEYLRDLCL